MQIDIFMSNFAVELFNGDGSVCKFYTVRYIDSDNDDNLSETDKFFDKFFNVERFKQNIFDIVELIDYIGNKGANINLFREERDFHAIPPKDIKLSKIEINIEKSSVLRLYCLRLTENVVILFNGDEKTSQKAQEGKTSMVFNEAISFTQKINEALISKDIKIKRNKLVCSDNSEDIFL